MIILEREQAYRKLRDAITYGELKPGEKVTEETFCERHQVGRTPLREALRRLEMEGYIDVFPNRGAFVRKISIQELEEIYEVLALLEGYAVECATGAVDSAAMAELRGIEKALTHASTSGDASLWLDGNASFHGFFQRLCGNGLLSSQIDNLRGRTYRYRALAASIPGHIEEYMEEHRRILEAVAEGKSDKAGRAMRRHVQGAKKILVLFLKDNPWV